MLCCKDVECSEDKYSGPCEQGTLPALRYVRVIVEDDEGLDDVANEVGVNGDDALPGNCREPPCGRVNKHPHEGTARDGLPDV